ncbi:MAG TPA: L,D-transpeptidase [Phycisphaerales bacterium]|nr:L,D-transpeptidase [Phycisphaerales bacterium]
MIVRTPSRIAHAAAASLGVLVACIAAPAQPDDVRGAQPQPRIAHTADPAAVQDRFPAARVQTLLARANFSPGLIDAKPGRKTRIAVEQLQRAKGLEITGTLDDTTLNALAAADPLAATKDWCRVYTITAEDCDLITGPIPEDWNERAALDRSGYADMTELLAERGWCAVELARALNPETDLDTLTAGDEVVLPDVRVKPLPKLSRVVIDLTEKLVLGYGPTSESEPDSAAPLVMLTHCSIARMAEKRPVGELHVKVIATDPEYTFNPADWPEIDNVTSKLRIPPGPRNPVGVAWIGLDKPGYGMHGTVRPQDIGKTGSHGCFRLCNWDAARLARAVRVGTAVEVRE